MVIGPVVLLDTIAAAPWKNGGGSTRTLAVYPLGASLDDFVWRVSLAEVASSGPFSNFTGVDRTIALWSGNGMLLDSPGRPAHRLERELEPHEFPGEIAVQATLLKGPTIDFNLMIRRGAVAGMLLRCDCEMQLPQADDLLLVCRSGGFRVDFRGEQIRTLAAGQMLHLKSLDEDLRLLPIETGSVLLCMAIRLPPAIESASQRGADADIQRQSA